MQQKAKRDKQQSIFTDNGKINKPRKETIKKDKLYLDSIVYCPFCLYRDKLSKFLVSEGKKGISTWKAKCPECEMGMLMRTIKAMCRMTESKIEEYARWAFEYAKSGYWKKVKFEVWKRRLQEYGWSIPFWRKYRELKGRFGEEEIESKV